MTPAEKKARQLMNSARARAKAKNLPYRLGWSDMMHIQSILMGGHCDMSGQAFGPGPFAPTLDRIIPKKGYVPGNVRVICRVMNFALNNWGEEVLHQVVSGWLRGD